MKLNGYLIMARCTVYDIPMGFFADKGEARKFGTGIKPGMVGVEADAIGYERSTPLTIDLIPFVDQIPGKHTILRYFDQEDC
jgi:hypothetical protein